MAARLSYRFVALPNLSAGIAVAVAIAVSAALAQFGWFGPGGVALAAWTYAVGVELHRSLPPTFFEPLGRLRNYLLGHVLCVSVSSALLVFRKRLLEILGGLDADIGQSLLMAGYGAVALAFVGSAVCCTLAVRHVLSALRTAESASPSRSSLGLAVLGTVFLPVYVASSHLRARLVLLGREGRLGRGGAG